MELKEKGFGRLAVVGLRGIWRPGRSYREVMGSIGLESFVQLVELFAGFLWDFNGAGAVAMFCVMTFFLAAARPSVEQRRRWNMLRASANDVFHFDSFLTHSICVHSSKEEGAV